ncbi:MAG: hypothetical protein MZV70_35150 [Desulfobacterales bacterium]|nr:hypothetical protein [Desulfobacterales bacterium]
MAARALENDPAVAASRAAAETARVQYELKLDEAKPRFILGLTPFSLDQRRIYDFTVSGYADTRTLSAGGGLTLNQALPTAGTLSAGAETSFKAIDTDGPWNTSFRLPCPPASASPWGPGAVLPTAVACCAAKRSASLAADQAALDDLTRRNQAVRARRGPGRPGAGTPGRAGRPDRQPGDRAQAGGERPAPSARRHRHEDAALELELAAETLRAAREDTRLAFEGRRAAPVRGPGLVRGSRPVGRPAGPWPRRRPPIPAPPRRRCGPPWPCERFRRGRGRPGPGGLGDLRREPFPGTPLPGHEGGPRRSRDPPFDYFGGDLGTGVNLNLTLTLDVPLGVREARPCGARADRLAFEGGRGEPAGRGEGGPGTVGRPGGAEGLPCGPGGHPETDRGTVPAQMGAPSGPGVRGNGSGG